MATETGPWAHSKNDAGERHELAEHLRRVADMARAFAEPFGGGELAYWAGLWHDLGKFHPEFQEYLLGCEAKKEGRWKGRPPRVDHKGAGTVVAAQQAGQAAFLVAGHHGGLHRGADLGGRVSEWRAQARVDEALVRARTALPIDPPSRPMVPSWLTADRDQGEEFTRRRVELFVRMLFSCLVDADFLDTETHFRPERADLRGAAPALAALRAVFDTAMAELTGRRADAVGRVRHDVYTACLRRAALPSGFFRLTVPTGGGKTLAGLAFALEHARVHGLERVIVVVPYTSITEQTATVYRRVFAPLGDDVVLEHHSALDVAEEPSSHRGLGSGED